MVFVSTFVSLVSAGAEAVEENNGLFIGFVVRTVFSGRFALPSSFDLAVMLAGQRGRQPIRHRRVRQFQWAGDKR